MALFDRYLMVDWSAASVPRRGEDSIWACLVERRERTSEVVWTRNFPTRRDFMDELDTLLAKTVAEGRRLLAGFDFAFGYPKGAAERLSGEASWRSLWRRLAAEVRDGDDNANNRFEVAGQLNRRHFAAAPMFWGVPNGRSVEGLAPGRPDYAGSGIPERRLVEQRARTAQPVWKLCYAGSVGGQAMLGIARLSRFIDESPLGKHVRVWPFETHFDRAPDAPCVLAEIYPSLFPVRPKHGEVKDEAQVRTAALAFASFDAAGQLRTLLRPPMGLAGEDLDTLVNEEGWMLGLGHEDLVPPAPVVDYIRDPAAIYAQSFATIRAEADLARFPPGMMDLVVRLIHACGMVDLAGDIAFSEGAFETGAAALQNGAPVLCDAEMVRHGIIRRLLPADNDVICLLNDERVRPLAAEIENTRSAAQVDLWADRMEGAVVAIGNAPTALFRLLELLDQGAPRPAIILGFPVGFVGAAESKEALIANPRGVPFIAVRGRRGGSAMASAAVNALAGRLGTNV